MIRKIIVLLQNIFVLLSRLYIFAIFLKFLNSGTVQIDETKKLYLVVITGINFGFLAFLLLCIYATSKAIPGPFAMSKAPRTI